MIMGASGSTSAAIPARYLHIIDQLSASVSAEDHVSISPSSAAASAEAAARKASTEQAPVAPAPAEAPPLLAPLAAPATPPTAAPLPPLSPVAAGPEAAGLLASFGFSMEDAEAALRQCSGNSERAANLLFSGGPSPRGAGHVNGGGGGGGNDDEGGGDDAGTEALSSAASRGALIFDGVDGVGQDSDDECAAAAASVQPWLGNSGGFEVRASNGLLVSGSGGATSGDGGRGGGGWGGGTLLGEAGCLLYQRTHALAGAAPGERCLVEAVREGRASGVGVRLRFSRVWEGTAGRTAGTAGTAATAAAAELDGASARAALPPPPPQSDVTPPSAHLVLPDWQVRSRHT